MSNRYAGGAWWSGGRFIRCKHGYTKLSEDACWRCGLAHPIRFIRHWWGGFRND